MEPTTVHPTTVHPSTDIRSTDDLGRLLSREMRHSWSDGQPLQAEHFFARQPELLQQPEAAIDLLYEEYCLRLRDGHQNVEQDILGRFPQWAGPLQVMFDCHKRLLESEGTEPPFPKVGDRVGDFDLLSELAHGSRGRVFLAAQRALADRPVVLKLTPLDGREHLSLARLQHTNIVPLYSVLDDPVRRLRVLCMPYFGRATLASLHQSLANVPRAGWTGQHVADVIDRLQESSVPAPAAAGAARQMLAHATYVQAICWITACLADALQFAHERGLVHLDLKPSNILLAADGQPMLLDFHLAREVISPGTLVPDHFGGTLPYMPPEQQSAMKSLRNGEPAPAAVDARADIYALGAILYESLGGSLPITVQSPPLIQLNPQVSAGLSDIVARCVAAEPEDRYTDAQGLADDLRRHLTDQPLAGVSNRSLRERWSKFRRRRPGALRAAGVSVLLIGAAAVVGANAWSGMRDRQQQAEMALFDGRRQLQDQRLIPEAARTFERGLQMLEGAPFQRELRNRLRDQLAAANRLELAHQLHRLADEIRVFYGSDFMSGDRVRPLAAQSVAFWNRREAILEALTIAENPHVAADLQDIAIFAARLQVKLAADPESLPERRLDALRILDQAIATFGPNAVLTLERQLQTGVVDPIPAATTAWEHYALGRALLAAEDYPRAASELAAAVRLDPTGRWPNFCQGLCAYRMGGYEDAIAAFSVCIGAAPDVAGFFYNRALAYVALSRPDQARSDYDSALRLDPAHAAAALNRGVLNLQQRRFDEALADLNLALVNGADPATTHYDLALLYIAREKPATALEHAELALENDPMHDPAQRLRDRLRRSALWK